MYISFLQIKVTSDSTPFKQVKRPAAIQEFTPLISNVRSVSDPVGKEDSESDGTVSVDEEDLDELSDAEQASEDLITLTNDQVTL